MRGRTESAASAVRGVGGGRIGELQALRLGLHRLEPSRPLRTARAVVSFIKDRGIVLSTGRSSLPMLAEAIAGRPIRGSWMADPEVYRIYRILGRIRKFGIIAAPLILGKETLLDSSLGPAVARIAQDRERGKEVRRRLPPLARRLLDAVEARGEVRMDRWEASTKVGREARLLLEQELLVISSDLHTERGYHTSIVKPWAVSRIAQRFGKRAARLAYDRVQETLWLAAVRSAIVVPEREARRWFVFGNERLEALIAQEQIERLVMGRTSWLTCSQ